MAPSTRADMGATPRPARVESTEDVCDGAQILAIEPSAQACLLPAWSNERNFTNKLAAIA